MKARREIREQKKSEEIELWRRRACTKVYKGVFMADSVSPKDLKKVSRNLSTFSKLQILGAK